MRTFYTSIFTFLCLTLQGQIIKSIPFELGGQIEPSFVPKLIVDNNNIYTIARIKGKPSKDSDYSLNCRDQELTSIWSQTFHNFHNSEIIHFEVNNDEIRLFTNTYNKDSTTAHLIMDRWLKTTGSKIGKDTISSNKVHPWKIKQSKGKVKQTFANAILSIQYTKFTTPLEYRIELSESPDQSIFLAYSYDYSRPKLYIKTKLYNKDLLLLKEGEISVDDHYTSYGLNVNNEGQLILYKANENGRVVAIRYELDDNSFKYVSLFTTNSTRDNLTIVQQDSSHMYMAKLNRKNDAFVGVTYSKFNFEKEKIDETRFQSIDQSFKNKILGQLKERKIPHVDKNWFHYELTDFFIDADSNKIVLIEERDIMSTQYNYLPEEVEDISKWTPKDGRVKGGNIIAVAFDKDNKLLSLHNFVKNQEIDATDGLNTISYFLIKGDNTLKLLMSRSSKGGTLNEIELIHFDYINDQVISQKNLDNPEKLVLTRPYISYKNNTIFFVGRKGILGKKTYLVKYKLK